MKRSFLTALSLEKDVIDQIMTEHGASIETLKEKHNEAVEALKSENKKLKDSADDGNEEKLQKELDDMKSKLEAEKAAHEATKDGHKNEKTASAQKKALLEVLKSAGASDKAAALLLDKLDKASAKFEGDADKGFKISNADDVLKPVKDGYSEYLGTTKVEGANPANPPKQESGGYAGKTATELMKEANENPAKLDEIMSHIGAMNKPKKE